MDKGYWKEQWIEQSNCYDDDTLRLKRLLIATRNKPPRRIHLRRWLFWLMITTLTIQGVVIVLLKWDASLCRLLNY